MKKIMTHYIPGLFFLLLISMQTDIYAQSNLKKYNTINVKQPDRMSLTRGSTTGIAADLLPDTDNKLNIGSPSLQWKNIYLSGSLFLDGANFLDNKGGENLFVGNTGNTANTASSCTFVGYHAGNSNTNGEYNVFVGHLAGSDNTEGHHNTFVGESAGQVCKLAYYDTFIGNQAGALNDSGSSDVFVGQTAGFHNVHGSYNTFIGKASGYSNKDGFDNSFLGKNAGHENVNGFQNTYLGRAAGYSGTGSNNTMVGAYAGYQQIGSFNVFIGESSSYRWISGNKNTIIGDSAGIKTTKGNSNIYIGFRTDGSDNLSNAIAIGAQFKITGSNTVVIGNSSFTKVGFGVNPSQNNIMQFVNTSASLTTGGVWSNASDRKLKDNFEKLDSKDILSRVKMLDIQRWNYKVENQSIKHIGPVAQDFNKLFGVGNDTTISTIDPAGVALVSIKALISDNEDLRSKNEELTQQYATQQLQLDDVQKQLSDIKAALSQCCVNYNPNIGSDGEKVNNTIEKVSLIQNSPNPFSNETTIQYTIPQSFVNAEIRIASENGDVIKVFTLYNQAGFLTLKAVDFTAGTYHYSLFTDGKELESKVMVISR
ncbi:MAG: tail fiber domain-containing protein [Chitinophagales bacterium]|nr:tail fiber domain-containing protein [Chitinophagales bacterium]